MDHAFRLMRFPLDDELDFCLKMILFTKRIDLELPLIFILFFKKEGKQNKKENPKCDSLFWKRWFVKSRIGLGGQVTYREGMA